MLEQGTTVAEVKSGYGLSTEAEIRTLRAIRRLATLQPIELIPTFLGAHEFPPNFGTGATGTWNCWWRR
jgi:imidazolonepropionase